MINRTKIASLAVCAILSAAVLTGCGGSSASSSTASSAAPAASSQAASSVVSSAAAEENGASDLDGIYNALLQADPISNQFEIAAMNIEYDFGLQAEERASISRPLRPLRTSWVWSCRSTTWTSTQRC